MRTTMRQPDGSPMSTDVIAVEVVGFNLAGVPISVGEPFRADEDWLKNLRARLKNISEKPISQVRIIFSLPEARFQEGGRDYGVGFTLTKQDAREWIRKCVQTGEPFVVNRTSQSNKRLQLTAR
jgi:hypothetical protein